MLSILFIVQYEKCNRLRTHMILVREILFLHVIRGGGGEDSWTPGNMKGDHLRIASSTFLP